MPSIPVFFISPTDRDRRWLRRYAPGPCSCAPGEYSYHNALAYLDTAPADDCERHWPRDDPRWPRFCDCGYEFESDDHWQLFTRRVYVRADTGDLTTLEEAPVGACWHAWWAVENRVEGFGVGPDGRCLVVKTPGGEWWIDTRAGNCTMPEDNIHKCWVRHGRPEDGTLHVDKNGFTCSAGAGSIQAGAYHGFLHHGSLTDC